MANQIAGSVNIEAVTEALLFAAMADAGPGTSAPAPEGWFCASKVRDAHGERRIKRKSRADWIPVFVLTCTRTI